MSDGVQHPAGGSQLSGRQVSSEPGQEFRHSTGLRRLLYSPGTETSSQASHCEDDGVDNDYTYHQVLLIVVNSHRRKPVRGWGDQWHL